ncbi:MAG: hypothetical protein KKI08_00570, partial [Armatimonadetes bacterium]|nr:hypothetical protein [Armatimonadota bacterium]
WERQVRASLVHVILWACLLTYLHLSFVGDLAEMDPLVGSPGNGSGVTAWDLLEVHSVPSNPDLARFDDSGVLSITMWSEAAPSRYAASIVVTTLGKSWDIATLLVNRDAHLLSLDRPTRWPSSPTSTRCPSCTREPA